MHEGRASWSIRIMSVSQTRSAHPSGFADGRSSTTISRPRLLINFTQLLSNNTVIFTVTMECCCVWILKLLVSIYFRWFIAQAIGASLFDMHHKLNYIYSENFTTTAHSSVDLRSKIAYRPSSNQRWQWVTLFDPWPTWPTQICWPTRPVTRDPLTHCHLCF